MKLPSLFEDEDWRITFYILFLIAFCITLVILVDYTENYLMARKGLCWSLVQMPNSGPSREWQRCK